MLDRQKMQQAPELFRVGHNPHTYVLGLELARELKKRKLSNILVEELVFSDARS